MKMLAPAVLGLMLWMHPSVVTAALPAEEMRASIDKVLATLKDPRLQKNPEKRREAIKEIIRERFDFGEMARRSLGPEWQRRTPEERKEFVNLFIDLLERAYISAIEDVESVRDLREKVDGNYAEVRTRVVDKKGVEFSVDYRLHNVNGRWRVYDVLVENVSLVNNYRDQFNRILTRYSYEELIRRMKSKQFEDAGRVAKKTGTD
ncbi:MAG TPA: ABC transporter substrate-binding protein [Candidatus Binatia bacterium]|nr:ABC transporter substrate-binding protein [Candidatus Binatia bacterium]